MPTDRRQTIEALMDAHGTRLLRLCCLYLKDAHLAEDAVQETFLRAWRKIDSFRGECSESTWLTGIAVNVCRDMLRTAWLKHIDRRVEPSQLPGSGQADAFPDDTVLAQVMALPARLRAVILLRYYQGLTLRETADALSIGLSTVKQRQQKANQILRKRLKEWYFDD